MPEEAPVTMAIFFLSDISLLLSVMRVADRLLFACRTFFYVALSISVLLIFSACVSFSCVSVVFSPVIFIRAWADQAFCIKSDQIAAVCL